MTSAHVCRSCGSLDVVLRDYQDTPEHIVYLSDNYTGWTKADTAKLYEHFLRELSNGVDTGPMLGKAYALVAHKTKYKNRAAAFMAWWERDKQDRKDKAKPARAGRY